MIELEYVRCLICNGNNEEPFIEAKNLHGSHLISEKKFSLVRCKNCGLVYLNPRPAKKEINKYYGCDYYSTKGRFKTFIAELILPYFILRKRNTIIQFKKLGKILDVGCGNGDFLSFLSLNNKWELYGVEPNPIGYNFSKQKIKDNIFNKDLLDCKFPTNYFDIVTMWHVLEHIYEPNEQLREINRTLKDDGLLIIAVPNIRGFGFKMSRANWFHLDAPRHLYHYDSITIKKILNKNGFHIFKIAFPSFEFPLDLYHSLLKSFEKNEFIKIPLILPLLIFSLILKPVCSLLKASETMIVVCKKGLRG